MYKTPTVTRLSKIYLWVTSKPTIFAKTIVVLRTIFMGNSKMNKDLPEIYSFLLDRTVRVMKQHTKRKLREVGADITIEQFAVLKRLDEVGDVSQKELAEASIKDAPTVTRIIDLLCKKGYTERQMDPNDRRVFIISLTKKGQKKIAELLPMVVELRELGWKGLTQKDLKELKRILGKVEANFS